MRPSIENGTDNDEKHSQLENHRSVKQRLLPLSTVTQQQNGVSSQSAVSLDSENIKQPLSFHQHQSQENRFHRRSLLELFYSLFEPRDNESQRIVRCRDPKFNKRYCDNTIKTSRYNIFTFIPLNLFEQFLRSANLFFLTLVFLQAIPVIAPYGPIPKLIVLSVIIGITALRQGVDDFLRFRSDQKINQRRANVVRKKGDNAARIASIPWKNVVVGDILCLKNNEAVPADVVLLSTSDEQGLCYVETAELDGETNLKYRHSVEATQSLGENMEKFMAFDGEIHCEAPNNHLSRFTGRLDWHGETLPVNNSNLLLRGCTMRNTEWAFGVVVYAGRQTKLMKNAGKTLFKRTQIEKGTNKYLLALFGLMLVLLLTSAIWGYVFESGTGEIFKDTYSLWMQIDGIEPKTIALLQCLSYLILVQQLLPVTLYTTIEFIQIFLSRYFINGDRQMYDESTDTPAQARSTSLNEDLGQIQYIFCDKTGTLTQNVMTFNKCSIDGVNYGGLVGKKRIDFSKIEPKYYDPEFEFYDESLVDAASSAKFGSIVDDFFILLALCHTLNVERDENGRIHYKAQSPDEGALVTAARCLGYVFKERSRDSLKLSIRGQNVSYKIETILEFDTSRKRMSIVVVDEQHRRRLFCKGADSVIMNLLDMQKHDFDKIQRTKEHLHEFACDGLRTLCCAVRDISDNEWNEWLIK